jgi:6-phosphogluconate dehydrogenase
MELGMIGLGKMGGFMTERLVRGGHRVIGFDRDPAVVQKLAEKGAGSANSLDNIISQLKPPRAIWLMVPAGDPVDQTIAALVPHLAPGDTIIDGGNSYYKDSMRRADALDAAAAVRTGVCARSGHAARHVVQCRSDWSFPLDDGEQGADAGSYGHRGILAVRAG